MRCFISVDVDCMVLKEVQDCLRSCVSGSFTDLSTAHFTLCFLGEKSEREVDELKKKLGVIVFPSFEVELRGVGFFPSITKPRVAWVGVGKGQGALIELQKIIANCIEFEDDVMVFSPHVTLARIKTVDDNIMLSKFTKTFSKLLGSFVVNRFCLKKSVLGEKIVHEKIFEVKLA